MSQGGQVTLVGYLVSEPKLRFVNNGTPVVNLRVGSTSRRVDRSTGEWCDGDTSYFTVACWRMLASNVASCLRKGEPVIIRGKFRSSSYEDRNGQSRSSVDIEAEAIGHDLSKGVAHFQRTRRPAVDLAALGAGEAIRSGLDLPNGETAETDGVSASDNVVPLSAVRHDTSGPVSEHAAHIGAGPDATDGSASVGPDDAAVFNDEAVAELAREMDDDSSERAAG